MSDSKDQTKPKHDPKPVTSTGVVRPAPKVKDSRLSPDEFERVMLRLRKGQAITPEQSERLRLTCEALVEELGDQAEFIEGLKAERAIAQVLVIRTGELTVKRQELLDIPVGAVLRIEPVGPSELRIRAIQKTPGGIEVPIKATRIVSPN